MSLSQRHTLTAKNIVPFHLENVLRQQKKVP
jgi:hypothetical protein